MHPAPPTASGSDDSRVYLDRLSGSWRYEDDDGEEWEWQPFLQHSRAVDLGETQDDAPTSSLSSSSKPANPPPAGHWAKVLDDDMIRAQQAAYSVEGVDETQPAQAVLRRGKKRHASPPSHIDPSSSSKFTVPPPKKPKPITSLYVTGLPLDATSDEIARVFSRYGVLLEDDQGQPRVKMYYDDKTGMFKGEALVVYFKPESVELAIRMLDETSMRAAIGQASAGGPVMRVQRAQFPTSNDGKSKENASTAAPASTDTSSGNRRNLSDQDRKKIAKRVARLETKLSDWRDDPPSLTASDVEPTTTSAPTGRTVVLTKMFTLHELDSDPTLLLDLKQDVCDECTTAIGGVTNVVLWDKEPEGIITVRFQTPSQAEQCVRMMKGRFFAQRRIDAWVISGKPKFRKSSTNVENDDDDDDQAEKEDEKRRKDAFQSWLEGDA